MGEKRGHHYLRPTRDRFARLLAFFPDECGRDAVDDRRCPRSPKGWPVSSCRGHSKGRRGGADARRTRCRYQKKPTAPVDEGRQPRPEPLVPIHDPLGWRTRAPRGRVGGGCLGQNGGQDHSRLWQVPRRGARCEVRYEGA